MVKLGAALTVLYILGNALRPASATQFECPITVAPSEPFVGPTRSTALRYWHGTAALAVNLPRTGYWVGMGQAADYRDKLFWWSADYASIRQRAEMRITAHRLDRDARPLVVDRVNGARWEDLDPVEPRRKISVTALLHLMEFPSAGCWEVVGHHRDARLTFVVQVGE